MKSLALVKLAGVLILSATFLNHCNTTEENSTETIVAPSESIPEQESGPIKEYTPSYNEQISCNKNDCVLVNYNDYSELD